MIDVTLEEFLETLKSKYKSNLTLKTCFLRSYTPITGAIVK